VGSGLCHIADDSDDDEMDTNLKKYDASADDSVAPYKEEETVGPTFDETDEDEEVEGEDVEEEEEEEKPPSPKKKKKVVRRRKVVKSSE
jgi:hypothetical protein